MTNVVVYGTLKFGFGNHDVLTHAGGEYIGEVVIPNTTMYSLGAFPAIAFDGGEGILGEMYSVEDLTPVDRLEGYPHLYNRTPIDTDHGPAYVYFMSPETLSGMEIVPDGIWKPRMQGLFV